MSPQTHLSSGHLSLIFTVTRDDVYHKCRVFATQPDVVILIQREFMWLIWYLKYCLTVFQLYNHQGEEKNIYIYICLYIMFIVLHFYLISPDLVILFSGFLGFIFVCYVCNFRYSLQEFPGFQVSVSLCLFIGSFYVWCSLMLFLSVLFW